ncbi:MAG: RNA methyltransferase [Bacteroidetes bacterium]|nr:TrmH family RNA methyltransferase [Bacteroidota bacterium]MBV6462226.1 tRNA (guanosine(18)-2'-O)-methyltransferase [Flavobacteriales bacterium]WKZ74812.1 MAG: RNA methyltransferase [Vicingaceae bacterium]MCL4816032.1 RNA methyltransferase [Flavobacteriales bacterium]NOG95191.1 RNA methyltransferase [Bacteroidota bacterium]
MNKKLKTEELGRLSNEEYKFAEKFPVIVVLDNVRSLHNVGSVFRTCDAFLVESIYLCGITGTPPNREIQKTALGATDSVAWQYFSTATEAIQHLKKSGYRVCIVEQTERSAQLQKIDFSKFNKCAFVFGNEVEGVSQDIINLSDECVEIPQFGTKHSFNISVCAGIVLWEIFKKKSMI